MKRGSAHMADLALDTNLEGEDGRYTATIPRAWEGTPGIPAGGFMAALALRAAGRATALARPVSFSCQLVRAPRFEAVELAVERLRGSRRTETLRVSVRQAGDSVMEALIWVAADALEGFEYDACECPTIEPPDEMICVNERAREDGDPMPPMFDQLEVRVPDAWDDEPPLEPQAPEALGWHRFRPRARFDDAFEDACRMIFLADVKAVISLSKRYGKSPPQLDYLVPNIDLYMQFHRDSRRSDWLLVETHSPVATSGIVGTQMRIWTEDRQLVASSSSTLLCRRNHLLDGN